MKCSTDYDDSGWLNINKPAENSHILDKYDTKWARKLICKNLVNKPLGALHNLGNSCFINSVLQCLIYTPGMEHFTRNLPNYIYEMNVEKPCYLHHFGELCRAMHAIPESAPHVFYGQISKISPLMRPGLQQDAHEFLLALLNRFDEECTQQGKTEINSPIRSIFAGRLQETSICSECRRTHRMQSTFFDINLPITGKSIWESFEKYMESETVSSFQCEKCKKTCNVTKKQTFAEPPNILIISLIRFQSDGRKIDTKVELDQELNLRLFTQQKKSATYQLYGIICHDGRVVDLGHYFALTRISNGDWYQHDDSKFTKVEDLSQLFMCPYILFYRRVDHLERHKLMVTISAPSTIRTISRKDLAASSDEQQLSEASDAIPMAYSPKSF